MICFASDDDDPLVLEECPKRVWMCDSVLTLREMADKYGMPIPKSRAKALETRPYANAVACVEREYFPKGATKPADPGPNPSRCYLVGKYIHEVSEGDFAFKFETKHDYDKFRWSFTKAVKNPDESPGADLFVLAPASKGMPNREWDSYHTIMDKARRPPRRRRETFVHPTKTFADRMEIAREVLRSWFPPKEPMKRVTPEPSAPPLPIAWPDTDNNAFRCPITLQAMTDPVIASDGHTYERSAIEAWFSQGRKTSPMTNEPLDNDRVTPNFALRSLMTPRCT